MIITSIGGHAALVVGAAHQALADDGLERGGELQADLLLLGRREDGDDALNGLGGVQGVQGGEDQVAGFGGQQGGGDRFEVAHFADQDHVGILAQGGAQRGREVGRIDLDFALIDEAVLIAMQEFDGVLDGDARGRSASC